MMNLNKILVIGSYNIDLVSTVKKLPKQGETVLGNTFQKGAGGKGSNQAIAAARLGGDVSFIGCIGEDIFGKEAIGRLTSEGININYLQTNKDAATGTAMIMVEESGENQIVVTPGANYYLTPEYIESLDFKKFSWLVIQLEVPFETVKLAVEKARREGVKIILNPAPLLKEIIDILPLIDVITPNETEAELLTGMSIQTVNDAKKASYKLIESGARSVAITLGDKGVLIATSEQGNIKTEYITVDKVNAKDTTGAGDCFNGALVVELAQEKSLRDASSFAVKAASLSVQRKGAADSMPYRYEIN